MRDHRSWVLSGPAWWTLAILFTITWFFMLDARTLVPTDEGRYAEMSREMLASGDWITTRLNGIKYFEKPPLQIWMTALAFKLFGLGDWQARLWTGVCGFAGIFLAGTAGSRVFGRETGILTVLVLASSLFWAAMGHINTLDMGLTAGMTLALAGLLIAQHSGARADAGVRLRWMLACWAGMALAVLSKGLIGLVLPGAVLIVYTLVSRDWAIWRRLSLIPGLLVFFAITVPWFVLVSIRNPEFPQFFFIHEHFQRFTSKIHHRDGPWYYFVPILLGGLLPWLAVVVQSLWSARHEDTSDGVHFGAMPRAFQPKKLLLVWSILIFVFFSVSDSKLPSYVLPIFPALALLMAAYLSTASRHTWTLLGSSAALIGAGMLVMAPRMGQFAKDAIDLDNYHYLQPWALGAGIVLVASGITVVWWNRRQHQWRTSGAVLPALILALGGFTAVQLLMIGAEAHGRTRAGIGLVPAITAELTASMPLYAVGMYDQTLPFFLRRTMTLVAHADELEFGLEQEPALWLPTMAAFVDVWRNGPQAVALTRPDIFAQMQAQGLPVRVLARDSRRVAITNR